MAMEQQQRDVVACPTCPARRASSRRSGLLVRSSARVSCLCARSPATSGAGRLILTMSRFFPTCLPTEPLRVRVPMGSGEAVAALHSSTWRFPGWLTGLVSVLLSLRGKGSRGKRREWPGGRSARSLWTEAASVRMQFVTELCYYYKQLK